jgi:hypothetical protein
VRGALPLRAVRKYGKVLEKASSPGWERIEVRGM